MRILVSGSEGFIGSKLCTALHILGHEVVRFDRLLGSKLEDVGEVDLIFHFAAQTLIDFSISHPYEDALDNILLTTEIIQKFSNVRILYPASAASQEILSPYGLSKKVAGDYIKLLRKDYVILMLPNIYGAGGKGAINKFRQQDVLTVFGDGEQTRTIVHVDDVVKAFVQAIDWPTGEYQLGGEVLSINEIAKKIGKPIVYQPQYEGNIFASVIENTTPNWEPKIKLC